MKKKKMITENPNISRPDKKNGRLIRYREKLERENLDREKKRNALFRKRVRSASEKKAPETLRTKAYYRFSSEYPSVVSPDGFRENIPVKEKMTSKTKVIVALLSVFVFVFTLIALKTGIKLSLREPETEVGAPVIAEEHKMKISFITAEDFRRKTADEIAEGLKEINSEAILVEYKSEYGYVYFDTGSFIGGSADKRIDGAEEKIKELISLGVKCIAYISCFKDSVASSSLSGMEVLTSSGSLFADSPGDMWLDPYSDTAHDYLINIMKSAVKTGFSAVMLDNVCFPSEFYLSSPVYLSFTDGDTKNGALTEFINKAADAVGTEKLILCCDITAFTEISTLPDDRHGGTLLDTDCISFCLDLRRNGRYTIQLENSEIFRYVEEMPLAFILDAGALAVKALEENKEAYVLYAFVDSDVKDSPEYAEFAGIKNIISDLF